MNIITTKNFLKQYKKLTVNQQKNFKKRRDLFLTDQSNKLLNIHKLTGKFTDYYSFNIGGDLRVIYKILDKQTVIFVAIGTHDQLYS